MSSISKRLESVGLGNRELKCLTKYFNIPVFIVNRYIYLPQNIRNFLKLLEMFIVKLLIKSDYINIQEKSKFFNKSY